MSRGAFNNVAFTDAQRLVEDLGFRLDRTRGSHFVYEHPDVPLPLPLQPRRGDAKSYQLRHLWLLVQSYDLKLEEDR